jgi:hypothetical protein
MAGFEKRMHDPDAFLQQVDEGGLLLIWVLAIGSLTAEMII